MEFLYKRNGQQAIVSGSVSGIPEENIGTEEELAKLKLETLVSVSGLSEADALKLLPSKEKENK